MRTNQTLKTRLAGLLIVTVCLSLLAPAFAGAQDTPTDDQYRSSLTQISTGGEPPSSDDGLSGNVGPLPFTGFDVIAMAAVALAVTGLGLALQRAVSREPNDGLS